MKRILKLILYYIKLLWYYIQCALYWTILMIPIIGIIIIAMIWNFDFTGPKDPRNLKN